MSFALVFSSVSSKISTFLQIIENIITVTKWQHMLEFLPFYLSEMHVNEHSVLLTLYVNNNNIFKYCSDLKA